MKKTEVPGTERASFVGDKTGRPFSDSAWWISFGDEALNELIVFTLKQSPDAKHALLNVEAFRQQVIIAQAPLLPGVDFRGDVGRSRQPIIDRRGNRKGEEFNNFGLLLTASYEVDLWKKIANSAEVARLALLSSQENLKTVYQTLTANVTQLYFEISELQFELPIWEELLKVTRLQANDTQRGYFNGLVDGNTYLTTQQREEKARKDLFANRRRLSVLRFGLNTLMGREPAASLSVEDFTRFEKDLKPLPAGLPSNLLKRRPDVRMAGLKVRQALLGVGIKKAALLPALTLTASGGYRSPELSELTSGSSKVWSLLGGLIQPIFHRGAKKAAVKKAEIEAEMAVEMYRKVALNAFREVESALSIYEELTKQLTEEKKAYRNETIVYRRVHNGYLSGTRTYQELLSAKISLLSRKIIVSNLYLRLLENRVQLYTALGGGFKAYERMIGVNKNE
jgi:NodT family efflux transporter outer membrane factor (OMF) lipoprotein